MRILLTASASYVPPRGGATRSNLVWLRHLAAAGHECHVVCGALGDEAGRRRQLDEERLDAPPFAVCSLREPSQRVQALGSQIRGLQPDWVLVSSEDLGHVLLREAHRAAPGRVVYLAHTPQWFPFGPASWNPDADAAALVAGCAAIVAIGRHMAAYIERHTGRAPAVIHPPIYGAPPFPDYGCFERGSVTMVNPCELKGISIFLELARRLPEVPFAAVPGWGTNAEDRRRLEALPNFTMLPNARDIDEPLSRTRILLMPSLWYEGFGLSAMEAMLRGIPVVASDSGGLVEAKEGTGYVIPVHSIERHEPEFDEHALPRPVVPANDIAPWEAALRTLLGDGEAYRQESAASRSAALAFVTGLDAGRLERLLASLEPATGMAAAAAPRAPSALENLSPERRALLLRMMARKAH